jgi:hypothetical protein
VPAHHAGNGAAAKYGQADSVAAFEPRGGLHPASAVAEIVDDEVVRGRFLPGAGQPARQRDGPPFLTRRVSGVGGWFDGGKTKHERLHGQKSNSRL